MTKNIKSQIVKIISALALAALAIPTLAFASTDVSLASSKVQVKTGDTFTVTITVSPTTNESAYTSMIALSYNADVVSATGFTLAPTWLGLTQPGYDLIDNNAGSLIKTAGYPGGLASATVFGTVTFKALKTGTATISTTNATQIFDKTNQNIFSHTTSSLQVTVSAPAPAQTAGTQGVAPALTGTTNPSLSTTTNNTLASSTTASTTNAGQVAAVGATGGASSSHTLMYVIIALIVLVGAGTWYWYSRRA